MTSTATQGLPETSSALAGLQSAEANLAQTQAERAFTLGFSADAGLLGSNTTELVPFDLGPHADVFDRFRRDLGYSITFDFVLPLRDKTWAPRLAGARLSVEQARRNLAVAERNATLQQDLARTSLHDIDDQIHSFAPPSPPRTTSGWNRRISISVARFPSSTSPTPGRPGSTPSSSSPTPSAVTAKPRPFYSDGRAHR